MCGRYGWGEGGKNGTRIFCMENFIFNKSIKNKHISKRPQDNCTWTKRQLCLSFILESNTSHKSFFFLLILEFKDVLIKWSSYIISPIHSQWLSDNKFTIIFKSWHLIFLNFLLVLENDNFLIRNCNLLALLHYYCIFDTTNMLDTLPAMHEHSFLLLILATCGWFYVSYWISFSLFNIQLFLSLYTIFLFSSIFFTLSFCPPNFSFSPALSSSMHYIVHIKNIQLWLDF